MVREQTVVRCTVALVLTVAVPGRASEPARSVGTDGWTLEQFGSDVAVLRASLSLGQPGRGDVGLLLSCSGPDRRVRLSFPKPIGPVSTRATVGSALITAFDPTDRAGTTVVRFALPDAATILSSETAPPERDVVAAIGRMLLARPRALDVVASLGAGPVALTRLTFHRLFLAAGPDDAALIRHFLAACTRFPARRPS